MSKRGKDQLTGGTNDVNPQEMVIVSIQSGADTATITPQQLPIPRLPTRPGRNLVIEVLEVDYFHNNPVLPGAGGNNSNLVTLTTNPNAFANGLTAIQDTRILSYWAKAIQTVTAIGSWGFTVDFSDDTTDRAGHGVLLATDKVYVGNYSANTGFANAMIIRILYRWKEVSLTEYIGIVQSQQ